MLYTFNISHYLSYPFEDGESQKNFLIGSLLMLAGFFIPLLPIIVIYGYISQIMQKTMAGDKPLMPAWDNWEKLFKDGLRLYGTRIIFTLPFVILIFGLLVVYLGGIFFALSQERPSPTLLVGIVALFILAICLITPIGIITSILAYPAGAHAVAKQNFAAGFHLGEWWPILRKNLGGFLLIIVTTFVVSFVVNILLQIIYITVILACLVPILMPAIIFYMLLVVEPMAAQAYREGREKLNLPAGIVQESSQ